MASILTIEDDRITQQVIAMILRKQGYDVSTAQNGKDAFKYLEAYAFDLVLVDMMLPFTTGLEIVKMIKAKWPVAPPGVIVVSAIGHERTIQDSFNLGADDYLRKPFSPGELICRVERLLQQIVHRS